MKIGSIKIFVLLGLILGFGCKRHTDAGVTSVEKEEVPGYSLEPVNIREVKMTDDFWLPIIERVQEVTIDFAIEKCSQEGRFDNFLIAGGQMEGDTRGYMPFDDTDVYKIIEGASNSLISAPNPELEQLLDSIISIIRVGQEEDGYLTTWRTINPSKPPADWVKVAKGVRWESLNSSHELYNAGHLYEAAVVHHVATGKRNFLEIALKNAELMVKTFGDKPEQVKAVPGHQIIETGLIKLYQVTGNTSYLDLARYFLDKRGVASHHELHGSYLQDHMPVVEQDEVVGHSVRAVYMYAAMTDIAALQQDSAYLRAVHNLWENMINKKMYITGGIGARHDGEAFGEDYELPNLTAYSETCAAIGSVYWNHRLHNFNGDAKYFDVIERTLYNGLISGISLDGQMFFYPNALESDGIYTFNKGACTRQEWFDCSCCPTNMIRFIPSIPGLIYSKKGDELFVNLYASNEANIDLQGRKVKVAQETSYPWDGQVKLRIFPEQKSEFTVKLRIPGWARNKVLPGDLYSYVGDPPEVPQLTLNGAKINAEIIEGYYVVTRIWSTGDSLELNFPMGVRKVETSGRVAGNIGKIALERGPLVYAVESVDNKDNFDAIGVAVGDSFTAEMQNDLLGGVATLESETLTAIPYYAWSNRGVGKMKVWLPAN